VFGDTGTSPLYALQSILSLDNNAVRPVPGDVYGVASRRVVAIGVLLGVFGAALFFGG
jgi:KUP system potassium uptake protein